MTHRSLTIILIAALTISLFSACRHGQVGQGADTDSVNWDDSIDHICHTSNWYFNNFQIDSLELLVPEAKQLCIEHGKMQQYYDVWSSLVELYIANEDFEKGAAEARLMQEDALKRHNAFGLSLSYKMLGLGYAFSENYQEGARFLRKAVDSYPKNENLEQLLSTYNYLYQTLEQEKQYDAIDTLMTQWKATLDKMPDKKNIMTFQYFSLFAKYLMEAKHDFQGASAALDSAEHHLNINSDPMNSERLFYIRGTLARLQGNMSEALDYIGRYQHTAEKLGDVSSQKVALYEKSLTYEKFGHFSDALTVFRQFTDLKDSLAGVEDREKLNELNKRFEVAELKMDGERKQMAAERRQLYLVLIIVLLVMVAVVVFAYYRRRADRRMAAVTAEKKRIESELQIARDIQMSMVPSVFPDCEGLDMYASMTPARQVGGDLYGYVHLGDKLYFALGDVSGKGVPASLFMAQATRLFRTLASQQMMPAEICTRMNDALSGDDNESGMFVTFFLGLVDLQTGHLDFCNAGHNPPVLDGQFMNMKPNAPIGLWPGLEYEGEAIDTIKGRQLFLYIDGLNEAENTEQQQFGEDRLLDILRTSHFDSARQVVESLGAEVERHRNGAEPSDDLTMMCLSLS